MKFARPCEDYIAPLSRTGKQVKPD